MQTATMSHPCALHGADDVRAPSLFTRKQRRGGERLTWQKVCPHRVLTGDSRISLHVGQNASTEARPLAPPAASPIRS